MVKSRKHTKRSKRSKRSLKHRGGGQGAGYEPGGALNPSLANGVMVNRSYDACGASSRPGQMGFSPSGGLPGMKGGRYTTSLEGPIAGLAEFNKLGCTPNHVNPLNQHGGVGVMAAKDMGVYEAPTARYTTEPSQWTGSTGAPLLLNRPLDTVAWSKACTQTAGRRKRRVLKGKKGKKHSRKHRGGGLAEDADAALRAIGSNSEKILSQMLNAPDYKSGMTKVIGEYTFKATGLSREFDLDVKKTSDSDSTYVTIKSVRD